MAMEGFNSTNPLVIDAEAYVQPQAANAANNADLAGLSPTPLTPSAGTSSMCGPHLLLSHQIRRAAV